jgi:hypothetical protein
MSLISILKRSIRTAAAGLVFVGLVSPANATYQHEPAEIFPDLPASASADPASRCRPRTCPGAIGNRIEPTSRNTRPCPLGSASNGNSTRSWTAS